jgi:hypothetical protein
MHTHRYIHILKTTTTTIKKRPDPEDVVGDLGQELLVA